MLTKEEIHAHVKDHLQYVLIPKGLPIGYALSISFLDAITMLIGLGVLFTPLVAGFYPGAFDTTVHVTLGALIAALGFFRLSMGHLAAWIEIVLFVLGLLVLRIPAFMHMQWNEKFNMGHVSAGAAVMIIAVISGTMTFVQLKRRRAAR